MPDFPNSKFRSTITNSRYTKALFLEESYEDRSNVLYTLKDFDHDGYPSLYRKYLLLGDLTEIEFARTYFESWEHWLMVCECSWFKPYIARWREEVSLIEQAEALKAIKVIAKDKTSKDHFAANKIILAYGKPKGSPSKAHVGRPSKEEITKQAQALFREEKETAEELLRITNG